MKRGYRNGFALLINILEYSTKALKSELNIQSSAIPPDRYLEIRERLIGLEEAVETVVKTLEKECSNGKV